MTTKSKRTAFLLVLAGALAFPPVVEAGRATHQRAVEVEAYLPPTPTLETALTLRELRTHVRSEESRYVDLGRFPSLTR